MARIESNVPDEIKKRYQKYATYKKRSLSNLIDYALHRMWTTDSAYQRKLKEEKNGTA